MKSLVISGVCLSFVALAGCAGSGAPRLRGSACPKNFDPIPMKMDETIATKISTKPEESFSHLPEGIYSYEGAEVFYKEVTDQKYKSSGETKELMVSFKDEKDREGKWKLRTHCVANMTSELSLKASVDGITSLTVKADRSMTYSGRTFSFDYSNRQMNHDRSDEQLAVGAPKDNLQKIKGEIVFDIFKHVADGNLYELRYQVKPDKKSTYYFTVKLRRSDLPKPKEAPKNSEKTEQ